MKKGYNSLLLHQAWVKTVLLQYAASIFQLSHAVTFIDFMELKCIFLLNLNVLINIQQAND